jgi:hypothetical protein
MGVSTGVGDGDTLGAANGWDLWDSWVGLISPISHIGPIGSRSPECAPDAATLIDRRALLAPRFQLLAPKLITDLLITDY